MNYNAPVKRRRGQCLSDLHHPSLIVMMTYYPLGIIAFWGGSRSRGGETPLSVHLGIEHFFRPKKNSRYSTLVSLARF